MTRTSRRDVCVLGCGAEPGAYVRKVLLDEMLVGLPLSLHPLGLLLLNELLLRHLLLMVHLLRLLLLPTPSLSR